MNTRGGRGATTARSLLGQLSRFLPVGFYYKACLGIRAVPLVRAPHPQCQRTGTRGSPCGRPRHATRRHMHCDVAVIGSGCAGLSCRAGSGGVGASRRVVLVEEAARPGGSVHVACEASAGTRRAHPRARRTGTALSRGSKCIAAQRDGLLRRPRAGCWRASTARTAASSCCAPAPWCWPPGASSSPPCSATTICPVCCSASAAQRLLYRHSVAPRAIAS